jgi:hypothetical protein
MRKTAPAVVFVVAMLGAAMVMGWPMQAAHAQTRPGAQPVTPGQAPVGHRQPRAGDVPVDAGQPMDAATVQRLDQELDRKLKSICRGC